ncbi:hypothetical protein [Rhizobium herbae]|uniref:Uncharacterized protein n=1 Tax=Rhizobium herbae TaxID=508661 RepID=A0ABS4EFY3_9HYPH|nr:hypothetical protein [Rhizobium herbae]MBP1856850.1 hypothetical protein [Rhizobium herbae]
MGPISSILKWRDDRHRLAKLRFDLEDLDIAFRNKVKVEKLRRGSEEWERAYADFDNYRELYDADIAQLETTNQIRRASAWGVPIPFRPISEEPVYDDKYWDWHRPHASYYLSDVGKAFLRRETYAEMEMRSKPWIPWIAIGISVISLLVSLLKM